MLERKPHHKRLERSAVGLTRTRMKVRRVSKKPTVDGDSLRQIRDECDALVRTIVALRDEVCVTCPTREGLQVGHLFKREKSPVRWSLTNCNGQCPSCNFRHNEHPEFYNAWYIRQFGEIAFYALKREANSRDKLTYVEMLEIRDGLRQEAAKLCAAE